MANNYNQGYFTPLNPQKYIGSNRPKYRSGWELTVMRFCDNHPSVIAWASESLRIPYRNPFTGRDTTYYPDFLITYQDKSGNKISEIIEVKPKAQTQPPKGGPPKDARKRRRYISEVKTWGVNEAKWKAATAYCGRRNWTFKILTEKDLTKY